MSNRLEGKVAVVTGSGQGIGKAIAIALAQEGASVVTNNRKKGSTGLTTYNEAFDKSMTLFCLSANCNITLIEQSA